jgi:hypothetical protein
MRKDSDPADERERSVSRRKVLKGAGLAAASGVVAVAHPGTADALVGRVAIAVPEVNAVEFRGRISQTGASGELFAGVGYFSKIQGIAANALFAGPPTNEGTALFTLSAAGNLMSRVLDQSVHSLDIVGTLDVYERSAPGANFSDPASFQVGTKVASYAMNLQDVLAVFAPAHGLPTLSGDVRQVYSARTSAGAYFGLTGMQSRLLATGLGTLVDPVTLNANLEMAGNWSL